jgi:hypothetical protein
MIHFRSLLIHSWIIDGPLAPIQSQQLIF